MIVTENHVSDALDYLNVDPHPIALARKDVTDAENKCEELFSRAFLSADGPVEGRRATAKTSPDYLTAKAEEAEAILELERHRARTRGAEMLLEIWRTENANARAAERIR